MKTFALALALALAAGPALAANADQPYQNVDKRNDAGNGTGNAQVDQLNRGQLDENQKAGPAPALGSTSTATPPR